MALCLGRENGINHWRSLIGPTKVSEAKKSAPKSIRAVFGDPNDDMKNAVHGSDSPQNAGREKDQHFSANNESDIFMQFCIKMSK